VVFLVSDVVALGPTLLAETAKNVTPPVFSSRAVTIVPIEDLLANPAKYSGHVIGFEGYDHEGKLPTRMLYGTDDEDNRPENAICIDLLPKGGIPPPLPPLMRIPRLTSMAGLFTAFPKDERQHCVGHLMPNGTDFRILKTIDPPG